MEKIKNKMLSSNEISILIDIIDRLQNLNIEYMLTGSVAMNFYAEPRMTRDFDIIIEVGALQKKVFFETFEADYYLTDIAFDEAIKYNSMFNIIHRDTVTKADLIIKKRDEYNIQVFERKQVKKINDHDINVISKEDLIVSKIRWAKDSKSALQKMDIINLLETGYDKGYVINWLNKGRLLDFAKKYIDERYFS